MNFRVLTSLLTFIILISSTAQIPLAHGEDFSAAVVPESTSTSVSPVSPTAVAVPTITSETQATAVEEQVKKEKAAELQAIESQKKIEEQAAHRAQAALYEKASDMARIQAQITDFTKQLEELRAQIVSLGTEEKILEQTAAITALKIQNVELDIEEKKFQLKETYKKVEFAEAAYGIQAKVVARFIALLYKQNKLYFAEQSSLSDDPAFFLSNQDISSFILRKRYSERLREIGSGVLTDLGKVQALLTFRKQQLLADQKQLEELDKRLQMEKINYEQQKESKQLLLASTKGQEALFQKLIQDAIAEEKAIENDIMGMQNSMGDLESKIRLFSVKARNGQLSESEIQDRIKLLVDLGGDGKVGLDWPVEPLRGLSATFRDGGYAKHFGVGHNAIDIPTPQGTSILSPADGYVTKVRDNGFGYSYIVVAHNGGIMTLYGHVTKIMVNVGDFVKRGDVIGLSGATPGTLGAGWMTTGPHLHFEVFLKGKHVDPLLFLDTSKLPK